MQQRQPTGLPLPNTFKNLTFPLRLRPFPRYLYDGLDSGFALSVCLWVSCVVCCGTRDGRQWSFSRPNTGSGSSSASVKVGGRLAHVWRRFVEDGPVCCRRQGRRGAQQSEVLDAYGRHSFAVFVAFCSFLSRVFLSLLYGVGMVRSSRLVELRAACLWASWTLHHFLGVRGRNIPLSSRLVSLLGDLHPVD